MWVRWGDCNVPQISIWANINAIFLSFLPCFSMCGTFFFCSGLMASDWKLAPPAVYVGEPTPCNCKTAAEGEVHLFCRFFFALHSDGNLVTVALCQLAFCSNGKCPLLHIKLWIWDKDRALWTSWMIKLLVLISIIHAVPSHGWSTQTRTHTPPVSPSCGPAH